MQLTITHSVFLNTTVESGFLPLIHQPTRITETTGTLIDNIFSNNFEHETLIGNLLIKISDHLPQFAVVKRSVDISKATKYRIGYIQNMPCALESWLHGAIHHHVTAHFLKNN